MSKPLRLITQADSWKGEAQSLTIELLEDWLSRAKAGEIIAVALAGECADGLTITSFSRPRQRGTMIGALAHMQISAASGHGRGIATKRKQS